MTGAQIDAKVQSVWMALIVRLQEGDSRGEDGKTRFDNGFSTGVANAMAA